MTHVNGVLWNIYVKTHVSIPNEIMSFGMFLYENEKDYMSTPITPNYSNTFNISQWEMFSLSVLNLGSVLWSYKTYTKILLCIVILDFIFESYVKKDVFVMIFISDQDLGIIISNNQFFEDPRLDLWWCVVNDNGLFLPRVEKWLAKLFVYKPCIR